MSMLKVLLVDDEPDILEFLKYNLEANGFMVITTDNGISALEIAEKERPDIIVLDVMMPQMDGIEVCNQLREKKHFQNTIKVRMVWLKSLLMSQYFFLVFLRH